MSIYVCVASYGRPQILRRCLNSLLPGIRIIDTARLWVLEQGVRPDADRDYDNGSHRHWWKRENLGCAGARKFMVDRALDSGLRDHDILVFVDDDITARDDGWLTVLTSPILAGQADIAGVEPRIVTADVQTRPCEMSEAPDYVSGGWAAIRGAVFLSGVNFDERFWPNYWEDVDLCHQALRKGFRITGVAGVGLEHEAHQGDVIAANRSRQAFAMKWGLTALIG